MLRVLAGRYELVRFVGRGGMGEVWEGRDRLIARRVAVKLLPNLAGDTAGAELLQREACTAGGLNHPGVVTVHDLGTDEESGCLFLVMEFVEGRDVAAILSGGPPPVPDAVDWAAQVAAALECAHQAGVVHRDLKPSNLMLTGEGRVKILDFGIARFMEATNKSSKVVGTLAYMPPERFEDHPGDARSDLYSLGCVLHELLTGRLPFDASGPVSMMKAHLHEAPEPPGQVRDGIPPGLDRLVRDLLAKDPADRPATAGQVHQRLRAGADAVTVPSPPGPHGGRTRQVGEPPWAEHDFVLRHTVKLRGTPPIALSPDGRTLAVGDRDALRLWDLNTGQLVDIFTHRSRRRGEWNCLAFCPDGRAVAAGNAVGVHVWDVHSGQRLHELTGWDNRPDGVYRLVFSPDGNLLAGTTDEWLRIWDAHTGVLRRQIAHPFPAGFPHPVPAFSVDGLTLACASTGGGLVRLHDPRTGDVSLSFTDFEGTVISMAFSPDGDVLAVGCKDRTVRLLDAHTGDLVRQLFGHTGALTRVDLAFPTHGRFLATGGDRTVRIWDPHTGEQLRVLSGHTGRVQSVAVSWDGRTLASSAKHELLLWSTAT